MRRVVIQNYIFVLFLVLFCTSDGDLTERDHAEFYKTCNEGNGKVVCSGIPENCVASRSCKLGALVLDDDSYFSTAFLEPEKGEKPQPYAMVIAYTPFQKSGNYLAAACKPELTLADFRIVVYKLQASEIETGIGNSSVGTSGGVGKGESWESNCRRLYEKANHDYGTLNRHPHYVDHLVLNNEYVSLRYSIYPELKNPLYGELPGFKNSTQYSTRDGITFTNILK